MKRATFIVFVLVLWLATCRAPEPNMPAPMDAAPTPTSIPVTATAVSPTPMEESSLEPSPASGAPEGKLPASSFESEPYINEEAGFALDIPTGWTINETVVGPRGTQIQFLSSPDLAEASTIPAGQTRVTAVIYQWDPKNDLAAYVQQRKTAWEASGFAILAEQELTLELGLPTVFFTVQSPEMPVVYLITALQDQYLVISGEGDLEFARQIMERLRPISQ